jgi:hypothetical protein
VTNHVVVALIGEDVKQTRCSTCEADHEYKQAKIPPQRRKKDVSGVLYQQVLDGMPRKVVPGMSAAPDLAEVPDPEPSAEPELPSPPAVPLDEGPVHRPLIRATLPRLTDEPPQRREPDFTVRSAQHARPGGGFGRSGFRGPRPGGQGQGYGQGQGQGSGQGFGASGNRAAGPKRHGHGGGRPASGRPGNPQGHGGQGNRSNRPGGQNHGGKKPSR